mmetsp:Transcript_17778/g.30112  ORF Transcript_17778/g.30112 Transcript_17778/m.30112 type:complete len:202 (-) Transcript_17778:824-1429(-)
MHKELKDSLICGICLEIPIDPMECDNCRKLFCKHCISMWNKNCPYQCPGQLRIRPCSHILKEFIQILQITCHFCEELVLFSNIQEHEEWCKKDKCANKQCHMILEFRSRKEFLYKDKKIQVCDDICYQMFRLQQVLKNANSDETLLFFEQYFTEQEEVENLQLIKEKEEAQQLQLRMRHAANHQIQKFQSQIDRSGLHGRN